MFGSSFEIVIQVKETGSVSLSYVALVSQIAYALVTDFFEYRTLYDFAGVTLDHLRTIVVSVLETNSGAPGTFNASAICCVEPCWTCQDQAVEDPVDVVPEAVVPLAAVTREVEANRIATRESKYRFIVNIEIINNKMSIY